MVNQSSLREGSVSDQIAHGLEDLRKGQQSIEVRMAEIQGSLKVIESGHANNASEIKNMKDRLRELQEFRARNLNINEDVEELKGFMWRVVGGISLGIILIEAVIFYVASR